jgi:hypothetical protein
MPPRRRRRPQRTTRFCLSVSRVIRSNARARRTPRVAGSESGPALASRLCPRTAPDRAPGRSGQTSARCARQPGGVDGTLELAHTSRSWALVGLYAAARHDGQDSISPRVGCIRGWLLRGVSIRRLYCRRCMQRSQALVVISRKREVDSLVIVSPSGAVRRRVIRGGVIFPVAWSPKSDAILCLRGSSAVGSDRRLVIVSLRTHRVARLDATIGAFGSASWHR